MRQPILAIVGVLCGIAPFFTGGCAGGLPGAGIGGSGAGDAANCLRVTSRIGLNLQAHESEKFILLSSLDSVSADATGKFLDEVARRFYDSFSRVGFAPQPLTDKLVCVCVDSYNALDAYGRVADGAEVSWMDAFYSHTTNRVAVVRAGGRAVVAANPNPSRSVVAASASPARKPTAGSIAAWSGAPAAVSSPGACASSACLNLRTITHELAHQLAFNSGLQRRGATYPFWLTEGLATNFEADFSGSYGLGQGDTCHRCRLIDAKNGGRMISLDQFVGMIDMPGAGGKSTFEVYAEAWGLFGFLLKNHPQELRRYMAELTSPFAGGQSPESLRSRFQAVFGPIKPLQAEFLAYIDKPVVATR